MTTIPQSSAVAPELVEYLVDEGFTQTSAGRFQPIAGRVVGRGCRPRAALRWWVMRHYASQTDVAVLVETDDHLAAPVLIMQGTNAGSAGTPETAGVAASFAAVGSTVWAQLAGIQTDQTVTVQALMRGLKTMRDDDPADVVGLWLHLDMGVPQRTAAGLTR